MTRRGRRWLVILVTAWGLLLLALGLAVGYGGGATVAEQQDVIEAREPMDRAAVDLANAVANEAAVRIWGYQHLRRCRISLVRDGVEFHRRFNLFTRPGNERALLEGIARRLPETYGASAYPDDDAVRLSARADGFVELLGATKGRGTVTVDLRTGCRPEAGPLTDLRLPATRVERRRLGDVLDLVGATESAARWRTDTVECGESALRSVRLTVGGVPDRPLADSADLVPPDARVLLRTGKLLAYRQGAVSVIAEVRGERLHVTTTSTTC